MGSQINSSTDDISLIIDTDDNTGFFASNRESESGTDDIYKFKVIDTTVPKCTQEVKGIINTLKVSNELYFNDKKDPENWMIKKVVLKQLAKTLPKQDDRLKKAISTDDNVEGGSYLIIDDNDNVRMVQGNIIGTRKNSLYNALNTKNEAELISE
jgi:hypothetical protein